MYCVCSMPRESRFFHPPTYTIIPYHEHSFLISANSFHSLISTLPTPLIINIQARAEEMGELSLTRVHIYRENVARGPYKCGVRFARMSFTISQFTIAHYEESRECLCTRVMRCVFACVGV